MRPAVIGVRMHSGWGALVLVSNDRGRVSVIARERITVIDEESGGRRQPYHYAKTLTLNAAEQYISRRAEESNRLASEAIRKMAEDSRRRGYRLANCVVLTASGRELPPLEAILAAHPLIHTAEGEFFRNAICIGCEGLKIGVLRVRERDVEREAKATLGKSATLVMKQIACAGKTLGSPWTQDHKKAALAAWMVLTMPRKS